MSLLNFTIRKIQKGGATCNTGLDFINHVESLKGSQKK